jgi:hypothetical protein
LRKRPGAVHGILTLSSPFSLLNWKYNAESNGVAAGSQLVQKHELESFYISKLEFGFAKI